MSAPSFANEIKLESWEENALDRTEPISDNFNEQASGNAAENSQEGAADGASSNSGSDQTSSASAGLQLEPYEADAAYSTADESAQEARYDDAYDGPSM